VASTGLPIKAQDKAAFWSDTGHFKVNIQAGTVVPEFSNEINYFQFQPPFPNPFNRTTQFFYHLEKSGYVILKIYNLKGELIRTVVNKEQSTGKYQVQWDGRNENGQDAASGLYFVILKHQNGIQPYKRTLVR